jgi:hypothetical protein
MIVKLEDFLRRRSKISQVVRFEDIVEADGLREACEILFGDAAQEKIDEYIATHQPAPTARTEEESQCAN